MMKSILVLTLGGLENPSSNFRMRQYYNLLKNEGWKIIEFNQKYIYYPQISKNLLIHYFFKIIGLYFLIKLYNKIYINCLIKRVDLIWVNKYAVKEIDFSKTKAVIVQDIDDAIFYNSNTNFNNTLKFSNHIFTGNEFLQEHVLRIRNINSNILCTPIDLSLFPTDYSFSKKFVIGWIGSIYTNKYLISIQKPLNQFLNDYDCELHIISDNLSDFEDVFIKNVKLIKWNIDTYIEEISQFSVGLMPLNNSNWEKGKCSYKMLQYMACFKPVIVSPIGMNLEILEDFNCGLSASDEASWYNNLQILMDNKRLLMQFGLNGRKAVEKNFSLNKNYKVISKIFNNYVSK